MADKEQTRKTVAVIGSGMAGLVAAYLIQQDNKHRYEVKVFETVSSVLIFHPLLDPQRLSTVSS
jgi:predicted NAD/FAD-binding protein